MIVAKSLADNRPFASDREFWRSIPPIADVFKADALPELYLQDAATDDERYYVPLSETISTRPVWISPQQNMWAVILRKVGAGLVSRHYHPHQIFAYTISGRWGYLEHDWIATTGDFVYEPPGCSHTLVTYDCDEPTRVFFVVTGPHMWLDENGTTQGYHDVHDIIRDAKAHYAKMGLGDEILQRLFR
jgi:2,4'-dihydroxyacetophenone dioxygenase